MHLQQSRIEFRSKDSDIYASFSLQLWPLAVTVLRTGWILTTGHPLQVNSGKHIEFRHITGPSFTDVNAVVSA